MAKIVPNNEMGKVKPVITVLRHEPKNNKTIKMANAAPSNKVFCTSAKEARIDFELSATTVMLTPAGNCWRISARVSLALSTTSMTFAPELLITSKETAG